MSEDQSSQIGEDSDTVGEAIRVFVRIRPLNKRELAEKQQISWNFNDTSMIEDTQNGQRIYSFDQCFGPASNNQYVYEVAGKPIVLKAMEGYNGTVFTYGQTGSGKTWTMRGSDYDPGMMILCIRDLLDWVDAHSDHSYLLKVAYLEVYNEEINDLLGDDVNSKNLRIVSEDAMRGAHIGGLNEVCVKTHDDFMAVLSRGEQNRSYAYTNMNAESSRSHTIYRVTIEVREKDDEVEEEKTSMGMVESTKTSSEPLRVSYLNLVDLAGSERQKQTHASGKTLKEGANINKSLLALGAVINKLGESTKKMKGAKPSFIPYRDSKLTRILKQSLGGNTMTTVLCAVTPASMHREETVSTLKFGQLCKTIKNHVKNNDLLMDDRALIKQYRTTIAELRAQLEDLRSGGSGSLVSGSGEGTLLAQALTEKAELESRVRSLEALLSSREEGSFADLDMDMDIDDHWEGTGEEESVSVANEGGQDISEDYDDGIRMNDTLAENSGDYGSLPDNKSKSRKSRKKKQSNGNDSSEGASTKPTKSYLLMRSLQECKEEIHRLNERIADYQHRLLLLQREVDNHRDFDDAKAAFEEYEHNIRQVSNQCHYLVLLYWFCALMSMISICIYIYIYIYMT